MAAASLSSPDVLPAVRAHWGVSVRQLGRYLGVSVGFVSHLEAGRRPVPAALVPRLLPLLRELPPPLGAGPPAPPPLTAPYDPLQPLPAPEHVAPPLPDAPAPAPDPLRCRLRDRRLQLLNKGTHLAAEQTRAAALHHRRHGLALLQQLHPPSDSAEGTHWRRWLEDLAADLTRDDPDPAARAAVLPLLAARVAGLRAEVAALTFASLPSPPLPGPHPNPSPKGEGLA